MSKSDEEAPRHTIVDSRVLMTSGLGSASSNNQALQLSWKRWLGASAFTLLTHGIALILSAHLVMQPLSRPAFPVHLTFVSSSAAAADSSALPSAPMNQQNFAPPPSVPLPAPRQQREPKQIRTEGLAKAKKNLALRGTPMQRQLSNEAMTAKSQPTTTSSVFPEAPSGHRQENLATVSSGVRVPLLYPRGLLSFLRA